MKNTTKRALLIEWDMNTGERAGNINPRDANLYCNGWQNMDVVPAVELRLVKDERDLSIYDDTVGVQVIIGNDAINAAIDEHFKSKITVNDELIYSEHMKSKRGKIDFDILPNNREERLRFLKEYGIKGIKEIKPQKV